MSNISLPRCKDMLLNGEEGRCKNGEEGRCKNGGEGAAMLYRP